MVKLLEEVAHARLHKEPSTLVLGLLLYPFDLSVGVTLQGWLDVAEGEGSDLLKSYNSNVIDAALGTLSLEIVVNLTRAEQHLLDLRIRYEISRGLLDDSLESESLLELLDLGVSSTVLEELLGDGHDEGLAEGSANLASQQMEELGGGRALSETEVHVLGDLGLGHIVSGGLVIRVSKL